MNGDPRYGYANPESYMYADPAAAGNGNGAAYGAGPYEDPGRFTYGAHLGQAEPPGYVMPQAPSAPPSVIPQLISSAGDVAEAFMKGHAQEVAARERARLAQFQAAPWQGLLWVAVPFAIGAGLIYLVMRE